MPQRLAGRVLQAVSLTGLTLSLLILIVSAPHLFAIGGGIGEVLGNVAQYAWSIALLVLVFRRTRTIGLRAVAGAALAGFFGISALAVLIGKPLFDHLGSNDSFVPLFFAPLTEELLKLLPVAVFLFLTTRNRNRRPSLSDAVLLGFTVAAGFAIYENILYARGTGGGWFATLPLSALLPSIVSRGPMLAGGHAVYTGLAALGLAVTMLYGRRFRFARFAFPLTLGLVVAEHITVNQWASRGLVSAFMGDAPLWSRLVEALTLHGYSSTLVFLAGVAAIALFERRLVTPAAVLRPALGLREAAA